MNELYLRRVALDVIPRTGPGKRIEELRIRFSIQKANEGKPNPAKIEVFNLAEATRGIIEGKGTRVRLQAGYLGLPRTPEAQIIPDQGTIETIFVGDVTKVLHKIEGADIVTTIEAGDGQNRYRNARLEKGYPAGINVRNIIQDLAAAAGLGRGPQEGIPSEKYAKGLTLSGPVREHLDMVCAKFGLEWSIQDETLQIIPRDRPSSEVAVLLSSATGLVGSPGKTKKGIEFTSLLQPSLRPGRAVKLDSRFVKGTFKLRKVTHDGDSQGGDFLSKCEATR